MKTKPKKSDRAGWVMVFLPDTTCNWLPTQHPPAPTQVSSRWGRIRYVVESYCGPNLYVSTALAVAGAVRQKLTG